MRFALDFTFGVKFSLDLGCSCIQFVHQLLATAKGVVLFF